MPTFFINTSRQKWDGYRVFLDICQENRTLIPLRCALADWYDGDKGYEACARQIGDIIDGHVEVDNFVDLVLYIDLCENRAYAALPKDALEEGAHACRCQAMRILFDHVVYTSLVSALVRDGRKPNSVRILYGEEKSLAAARYGESFTQQELPSDDPDLRAQLASCLGLPEQGTIEQIAHALVPGPELEMAAALWQGLLPFCGEELIPGIRAGYQRALELWCLTVVQTADVVSATDVLMDGLQEIRESEAAWLGIESVSCPYASAAVRSNQSSRTLCQLEIVLHLLKCVEANTAYQNGSRSGKRQPVPFCLYQPAEIAAVLDEKRAVYAAIRDELSTRSFTELELVPTLRPLDTERFGLNAYGGRGIDYRITETKPAENRTEEIRLETDRHVTATERQGRLLLTEDALAPFDYIGVADSQELLGDRVPPEKYIAQALRLRSHHLEYLQKLKGHLAGVLSHYAGRSRENKQAVLTVGGFPYARTGVETAPVETAKAVSQTAYDTMLRQYTDFCAGRTVALTDIEEQCDWFVSRVAQIRESLAKIKTAIWGILAGLVLLYAPFVIIQWETIVKTPLSLLAAAASVAIPAVLLVGIYGIVAAAQRKKFRQAWCTFREKSNEALAANTLSVQKYDELLAKVIPALRWIYEYKLDVAYVDECCGTAAAKIGHHREKLEERIEALEGILSDLEQKRTAGPGAVPLLADAVDLNQVYCAGEKNRGFYTVADERLLHK